MCQSRQCRGSYCYFLFGGENIIEIIGIAVDVYARNKAIGSYMINQGLKDCHLFSIYAETDDDAIFYRKNGFSITEIF